jgi:hypothetical protein
MRASYVQMKRPDGSYDLVPKDEKAAWLAQHYPQRVNGKPVDIKRVVKGSWVWRDGKLIPKSAKVIQFPRLQVISDIEPFRNVAVDRNEIIGGRKQKRDMMKARGLEECGDMKVPSRIGPRYDAKAHQRSVVQSLKKALHQHGLGD